MSIKAYSTGLEIEVLGKKEEFNFPVETVLNFRDNQNLRREIPLIIKYNKNQKETIEYSQSPDNCYAGHTEQIIITINKEYKKDLFENGHNIERFMSSGKLEIKFND